MAKISVGDKMNNKEYDKLVSSVIGKESVFKNVMIAFSSGGVVGVIAEAMCEFYFKVFNITLSAASFYTFSTFIVIGSVLTGLGVFDKVLSIFKCGLIVPATGFANTMTSSAMDAKSEGFIKGIGASIFKLTGSIILYGVLFGIIFGLVRSVIL